VEYLISEMTAADWPQVVKIYEQGIAGGQATFETEAPTWERWDAGHRRDCRLVARAGDRVLGWAALSPVSSRPAYAGVAEVSVYVGADEQGRGIGRALLGALIERSEELGVWTLQAAIFPENQASVTLHERSGFRVVGRRERVARLREVWRDTVILERRSRVAGVD
jgi:L-amino acid N-acyltransferase YncA